ncbi:hypothetical protein FSST1_006778 [Fusarium sambucinum]
MPFAITGHVTLTVDHTSPPSSPQSVNAALRTAWCRVRQDHPSIASKVEYSFDNKTFRRIYRTIRNCSDKEDWLRSTFFEIVNGQTGTEFANSDPPALEIPILFVITPPPHEHGAECREIVIRAPHCTIDGIGTLMLLNNLLKHASDALHGQFLHNLPEFYGVEVSNLSPPYRTAAQVPAELNPAQQAKVDKMAYDHVFFAESKSTRHYLSLPFKQGAQIPGRHQRIDIIIDRIKTGQILAGCKRLGVTVTHAFNASIPFAMRELQGGTEQPELYYRCDLLRNLRQFCEEPFNTSKHPVTAYHVGSMFGFETKVPKYSGGKSLPKEFQRLLQEVKDFYRRVGNDSNHPFLAAYVWTNWLRTLPEIKKNPDPGPTPSPAPGVSLSSLGRVDELLPEKVGSFEISKPWVTGEELGNGYGIFLTSHRGEMNVTAAYNEAWHDEKDVRDFLESCIQILWVSLWLD